MGASEAGRGHALCDGTAPPFPNEHLRAGHPDSRIPSSGLPVRANPLLDETDPDEFSILAMSPICKEYISNYRKSQQKWLRELYNIYTNFIMTNEDNNHDTKYTNKNDTNNHDARAICTSEHSSALFSRVSCLDNVS